MLMLESLKNQPSTGQHLRKDTLRLVAGESAAHAVAVPDKCVFTDSVRITLKSGCGHNKSHFLNTLHREALSNTGHLRIFVRQCWSHWGNNTE